MWLIFQLPDRWNSINLVIEISKCSANSPFWVWIGLNCIFGLWDTSAVDFQKKTPEKITFKTFFSLLENWHFLENHPYTYFFVCVCSWRRILFNFLSRFLRLRLSSSLLLHSHIYSSGPNSILSPLPRVTIPLSHISFIGLVLSEPCRGLSPHPL